MSILNANPCRQKGPTLWALQTVEDLEWVKTPNDGDIAILVVQGASQMWVFQAPYEGSTDDLDAIAGGCQGAWVRAETILNLALFGVSPENPDNYDAFRAAFDFVGHSGVRFYLPGGTYLIGQELIVDNENFGLFGDGPLISIIEYNGSTPQDAVLTVSGQAGNPFGYYKTLCDFGVKANAFCVSALRLRSIAHSHVTRVTAGGAATQNVLIDGNVLVHFSDLSASAQIGIVVPPPPTYCVFITGTTPFNSNSNTFDNIICEAAVSYGLVIEGGTGQCVFNGGTVENNGAGVLITDGSSANLFNCVDFESNTAEDLVVDNLANFNQFNACLFETAVRINAYNATLINCRCGDILLDTGSVNCLLLDTCWNLATTNNFSDLGGDNHWIGLINLFNPADRENKLLSTNSTWSSRASTCWSPFKVLLSDGDDNYRLDVESRVVGAGNVAFDLVRVNQGAPTTTAITLGVEGKVGFGFPNISNVDARVSINGGLNVGAQGSLDPGVIAFENYLDAPEIVAPAAPAADRGRLFFRDNGAGKTQLVALFPTGGPQVIATEP